MAPFGALMSLASTGMKLIGSNKRRQAFEEQQRIAQAAVDSARASRSAVTNPYEGVTSNLSGMATDLSDMMSNPFESLGVATQAAEMQAEEADIALANTLDTLRSSGASAGGATALAQAALRSKKGVSASLEVQEAQNQKLRAQGDQQLQVAKTQEKSRIQAINIGEGQRMQQAEAAGNAFEIELVENRANTDMSIALGQLNNAQNNQAGAAQDTMNAAGGLLQGLGGLL